MSYNQAMCDRMLVKPGTKGLKPVIFSVSQVCNVDEVIEKEIAKLKKLHVDFNFRINTPKFFIPTMDYFLRDGLIGPTGHIQWKSTNIPWKSVYTGPSIHLGTDRLSLNLDEPQWAEVLAHATYRLAANYHYNAFCNTRNLADTEGEGDFIEVRVHITDVATLPRMLVEQFGRTKLDRKVLAAFGYKKKDLAPPFSPIEDHNRYEFMISHTATLYRPKTLEKIV